MTPLRTTPILLSVCAIAALGCVRLPSRGMGGAKVDVQLEPADVSTSATGSPSRLPTVQKPDCQSSSPAVSTERSATPDASTVKPIAEFDAAAVAEMSAFIKELENASHVDAATRNKIMATALQTPVEQQGELIQQYRAMLALGRSAMESQAVASAPTSATPVAVPLPDETKTDLAVAPVIKASHSEPITESEKQQPPNETKLTDLEGELRALLREMESAKAETAPRAVVVEERNDGGTVENTESENRVASEVSWQELVNSAIEKLEKRRDRRLDSDLREEDEARLRMLYLIADRRDDAVRAIASLEPEMQEFWSKQLFGLSTLLDSELISDRSNRLIESKRNLDEALRRLGESSPLFVRNLVFVTEVQSYGAYTPFDDYEFQPGEPVLLYAEVENYRCKETARGYHTALRSTYEIFDSNRTKVAEHEFSTNEEYCKSARRDFFTICEFRIPEKLRSGKFVLRLTVADLNGDKAGESSITFHIRDDS